MSLATHSVAMLSPHWFSDSQLFLCFIRYHSYASQEHSTYPYVKLAQQVGHYHRLALFGYIHALDKHMQP